MKAQIFTWKNPIQKKEAWDTISTGKLSPFVSKKIFKRDTTQYAEIKSIREITPELKDKEGKKNILGSLNATGSLVRGLSFGNSQGQAVQSSMDMQISGDIAKDINLTAVISDTNMPVGNDVQGYTQSLEEFDKIYLELNIKNQYKIRGGHLDPAQQDSYFGRYQRRSLGLEFFGYLNPDKTSYVGASAGVARSEFNRYRFQPVEGNQGPYRLPGKNNEAFISIISGSEQVFLDGVLLRKGENADYIVNYLTGEITFTSFRPVFRQNFITITYNYTNRNYTRYLSTGTAGIKKKNWTMSTGWFWEQDDKNAPIALNLTPEDRKLLAEAGNTPGNMFAVSASPELPDPGKILYKKIQSASGDYYEYSSSATETLYQVAFSFVGNGNGDYSLSQNGNNGRVFIYKGPGKGDFVAKKKLVAPERTALIFGASSYVNGKTRASVDVAFSNRDVNTFSSIGNQNNAGYAARFLGSQAYTFNTINLISGIEALWIHPRFYVLDRLQDVEFARDFNLPQEFNNREQIKFSFKQSAKWNTWLQSEYQMQYVSEKDFYKGVRHVITSEFKKDKYGFVANASLLHTNGNLEKTQFSKVNIAGYKRYNKNEISLGFRSEENTRNQNNGIALSSAIGNYTRESFRWQEVYAGYSKRDSLRNVLSARAYFRKNDSVYIGSLQASNKIYGLELSSEIIKTDNSLLSTTFHGRKIFNEPMSMQLPEETYVLGNIVFNQNLFKNGLRVQSFYELGNGREPLRDFQYVKVNDGQGAYKWTDYNGDGVQQLEEFELAEYNDQASYVRVFSTVSRYVSSNKNKIQLSLLFIPYKSFVWENKLIQRLQLSTSFLSQNSYFKNDKALEWNPFIKENNMISSQENWLIAAQILPSPTSPWNAIVRNTQTRSAIIQNFSQEKRDENVSQLGLGYRIKESLKLDTEYSFKDRKQASQVYVQRNFILQEQSLVGGLTWLAGKNLQWENKIRYANKNRQDGPEKLSLMDASSSLQFSRNKSVIRGTGAFIQNNFTGESNSVVGNQLLEGLRPGKNFVWSLTAQQALNDFIQLNLTYEGRNTGDRTIHSGSIQVRAGF